VNYPLKPVRKFILGLLLINIVLLIPAYLVRSVAGLDFGTVLFLCAAFSFISMISFLIFIKGQKKEAESQGMYSLVSIGLKFLLELVLIAIFFIVVKKNSLQYVVLFFVIYLTLTLYLVFTLLNILKTKHL
jgi:F0F1-type ATP synthase assembly protein I